MKKLNKLQNEGGSGTQKAEGVKLGRPVGSKSKTNKLTPHTDVIKYLIEQNNTYAEIARLFHVNRSTMKRFCVDCGFKRPISCNSKITENDVAGYNTFSDNNLLNNGNDFENQNYCVLKI